jgi:DNA helicase HerA-like ATPase
MSQEPLISVIESSATMLGRVAAPPGHESTSGVFYFWVDREKQVERTQLVTTESHIGGRRVRFTGIVQEVYRVSRQKDIAEESARFDGRCGERPPFDSEGVTYAKVAILCNEPVTYAPPTEESPVQLADEVEAACGYGIDRMGQPLAMGLLRNGGTHFAGTACVDMDFLLGKNGGHLNVNGIAGLGTKSTLLLTVNWLLLRHAALAQERYPSDPRRLQVVPVIFNVKNFDLFHIDRWNAEFKSNEPAHREDWRQLGVENPAPFHKPTFYAPQAKGMDIPIPTGGKTLGVKPFSWSLADVIEHGLFRYLFAEEDMESPNFGGFVNDVQEWLTGGTSEQPRLKSSASVPQTFQELLAFFHPKMKSEPADNFTGYKESTQTSFFRRLKFIVKEGAGVLRLIEAKGNPLRIPSTGIQAPLVIDLFGLFRTSSLQRFVVAAVFHQVLQIQTSKQVAGLKYLITLDELNRFAPRDRRDPITETIKMVAAEGRSQGIILLGGQQQASLVATQVIENAAIRAVGRSATPELEKDAWKFLGKSARDAASQVMPEDKLLFQPSFREPMLVKMPFPPFALSEHDVWQESATATPTSNRADLDLL